MSVAVRTKILAFVGLMLAGTLPAAATAFCEVKPTKDGFVALRAKPDAGAKLLIKVKSGEDVQLDDTRKVTKGWQPVIWRGADRTGNTAGWMRASLLSNECG
ncbi:MAG TPA: hypothetical protein PKW21_01670 [Rhabdaerophilum sp.]|nr:hypothetical protein [Rhabdaerophilum sp.]